jgi:integrase
MPCTIRVRDGFLVYRLRCRGLPGGAYESQERTGLRDTPKNRETLAARARVMTDEMRAGRFVYLRWFPQGAKALRALATNEPERPMPTLRNYAEETWLPRKVPPVVRAWCRRDYVKHLKCHITPALGELPLDMLTPAALERFRADLLKKGLALKTTRNVIDATLRALLRDARTVDKLIPHDIFADLPPKWWPRFPKSKPDPFDATERDNVLAYFREKRAVYYPFVLTAFATGARPGELIGLQWEDVDIQAGKLMVRRSRTLHEDNAPKTEGSERTIDLHAAVVAVLTRIKPLHATDSTPVFLNTDGRVIYGDSFVKHEWHRALRATGVRPRKFYSTRHTFISLALSDGRPPQWVAEYVGTSLAMLHKHYAAFIKNPAADDMLSFLGALDGGAGRDFPGPETDRDTSRNFGVLAGSGRAVLGTSLTRKPATKC